MTKSLNRSCSEKGRLVFHIAVSKFSSAAVQLQHFVIIAYALRSRRWRVDLLPLQNWTNRLRLPFQTVTQRNYHPLRAAVKNWYVSSDESSTLQLRLPVWFATAYRNIKRTKLDPAWNHSCSLDTWWKPFPLKSILIPPKTVWTWGKKYVAGAWNYSDCNCHLWDERFFFFHSSLFL